MNYPFICTRNKLVVMILIILLINTQLSAQHVSFGWANSTGGLGEDESVSIAVDHLNNTCVVGTYWGTVDFDPGAGELNLSTSGSFDVFIQKFNKEGTLLWAKSLGGRESEEVTGICTDANGDICIIGYFEDVADFDPGPKQFDLESSGSKDAFVVKLNSDGDFLWAKALGGDGFDLGINIAASQSNHVYLTGIFKESADLDPGNGTDEYISKGGYDIFIEKLDPEGNLVWARVIGSSRDDYAADISTDGLGNCFLAGIYRDTIDLDPGSGERIEKTKGMFIEKLDSNGQFVWVKTVKNAGNNITPQALDINSNGDIVVAGEFSSVVDFNPGGGNLYIESTGRDDAYILKLDSEGHVIWAKSFGGDQMERLKGLALDDMDNIYVVGHYNLIIDWNADSITAVGAEDIFIAALNSSGDHLWGRSIGGSEHDYAGSIEVNTAGDIMVSGSYSATSDFNPFNEQFNLSSSGRLDAFLVQLSSWPLKVDFPEARNSILIAPNPTNAIVTIKSNDRPIEFIYVKDVQGREVYHREFNTSKKNHQINLVNARNGVYSVQIGIEGELRNYLLMKN